MAIAQQVFEWISIQPHTTVGLWIHGYSETEFVAYSIVPKLNSNEPSAAVDVKANLSVAETGTSHDGRGRLMYVTNNSVGPQPYISCKVFHLIEDIRNYSVPQK